MSTAALRFPKVSGMGPDSRLLLAWLHGRVSCMRARAAAFQQRTHNVVTAVSPPKLDGSVPVSWLVEMSLRPGSRGSVCQLRQGNSQGDRSMLSGAHSQVTAVRLPRLLGIVPVRLLAFN